MNFLHSVLFTIKKGSEISLFSVTKLAVSKTDPGAIVPSRKICYMLPLLSPNDIVPPQPAFAETLEKSESALRTSWHLGYGENIFVCDPF